MSTVEVIQSKIENITRKIKGFNEDISKLRGQPKIQSQNLFNLETKRFKALNNLKIQQNALSNLLNPIPQENTEISLSSDTVEPMTQEKQEQSFSLGTLAIIGGAILLLS